MIICGAATHYSHFKLMILLKLLQKLQISANAFHWNAAQITLCRRAFYAIFLLMKIFPRENFLVITLSTLFNRTTQSRKLLNIFKLNFSNIFQLNSQLKRFFTHSKFFPSHFAPCRQNEKQREGKFLHGNVFHGKAFENSHGGALVSSFSSCCVGKRNFMQL